jgi:hypothetical protein
MSPVIVDGSVLMAVIFLMIASFGVGYFHGKNVANYHNRNKWRR